MFLGMNNNQEALQEDGEINAEFGRGFY